MMRLRLVSAPLRAAREFVRRRLRLWIAYTPITSFRWQLAMLILGPTAPDVIAVVDDRIRVERLRMLVNHQAAYADGWRMGAVSAAIAARRLPPALEDWARAYAHRDPEGFLEHLRTAPDPAPAPPRHGPARAHVN